MTTLFPGVIVFQQDNDLALKMAKENSMPIPPRIGPKEPPGCTSISLGDHKTHWLTLMWHQNFPQPSDNGFTMVATPKDGSGMLTMEPFTGLKTARYDQNMQPIDN